MADFTQDQRQEILNRIYKDFRKIIIFFCIGWIVFMYSTILGKEPGNFFGMLLGMAICGGPIAIALFTGASFAGLFKPDYEVITTYADGRKESDGGSQSLSNNLIAAIFIGIIMLLIGIVVQLIRAVILAVKYAVAYAKVDQKPDFVHGIGLIIVIGFVTLIGAPSVFGGVKSARDAAERKAIAKQEAALDKAAVTYNFRIKEDKGLPMEIVQIRYREDATIISFRETRDGYSHNFIYSGQPETRWGSTYMTTQFKVTTAEGGEFYNEQWGISNYYDSKKEEYTGFDVRFSKDFKSTQFDIQETSSSHYSEWGGENSKNHLALSFTGVRAGK